MLIFRLSGYWVMTFYIGATVKQWSDERPKERQNLLKPRASVALPPSPDLLARSPHGDAQVHRDGDLAVIPAVVFQGVPLDSVFHEAQPRIRAAALRAATSLSICRRFNK